MTTVHFPKYLNLGSHLNLSFFKNLVLDEKLKLMSVENGMHDFYHILKIYVKKQRKEGNDLTGKKKKKKNVGLTKVNYFPKLFFCYKLYINDLKGL